MIFGKNEQESGILLARNASVPVEDSPPLARGDQVETPARGGNHRLAFTGLFLFTMLLYLRPNELFPSVFGSFPLAKIVAIFALVTYVGSRLTNAERLTIWPIEMKMLALIGALGIAFIPIAASKQESWETLTDTFLKVAIIFVLMINLLDTRERLFAVLKLVVICGSLIALATIGAHFSDKLAAQLSATGTRVEGVVGGIFGNPNDLATSFDLLLPLALAVAFSNKGARRLFYFACAAALGFGVLMSFSRGGFLGLVATGGVLLWKLGRQKRAATALAALLTLGAFAAAVPSGYSDRILTIFHTEKDTTGSAQQRSELVGRAAAVAANHLVIGVGIGNFGVYSIHNYKAHNSYLEISAELGVAGLIAYLTLIFAPLRSLRRIERATAGRLESLERQFYYLAAALQAAIVAYMVCSLFGSIQYQWYLYYPVAYAVALRRLYSSGQRLHDTTEEPAHSWSRPRTQSSTPETASVAWGSHQPTLQPQPPGRIWSR